MSDIDYGKIIALHKAGWSNRKISDEMRMTEEEYQDALTEKLDQIDSQIKKSEREYNKLFAVLIGRKGEIANNGKS